MKLTEEQARERMAQEGIDSTTWGQMGGGEERTPQFATKLAGHMTQLRDMLEGMVSQKQDEKTVLEEKLARLKHGGGM